MGFTGKEFRGFGSQAWFYVSTYFSFYKAEMESVLKSTFCCSLVFIVMIVFLAVIGCYSNLQFVQSRSAGVVVREIHLALFINWFYIYSLFYLYTAISYLYLERNSLFLRDCLRIWSGLFHYSIFMGKHAASITVMALIFCTFISRNDKQRRLFALLPLSALSARLQ